MRRVLLLAFAAFALGIVGASVACGSFDGPQVGAAEESDAGSEASVAPPPDDAGLADAPVDAAVELGACRVARAPTCNPTGCERQILYTPGGNTGASPFAVTPDGAHVLWLEHPPGDPGKDGNASARLLRTTKAAPRTLEVLATGQRFATTLAVAGGRVYWTTYETTNEPVLRSLPVACAPTCPEPRKELAFPTGLRILGLRAAGSTLFAVGGDGRLFRVDVATAPPIGPKLLAKSGDFPALAVTPSHGYLASGLAPNVYRVAVDGGDASAPWVTLPDAGPDLGLSPITHDCDVLWGIQRRVVENRRSLVQISATGVISPFSVLPNALTFGIAADRGWVYVARPDGQSLLTVEKTSGQVTELALGNAWDVATDDDGVYWADHAAGTVWMLRK